MSQHEVMLQKKGDERMKKSQNSEKNQDNKNKNKLEVQDEQQNLGSTVLDIYEPDIINQQLLRDQYKSLEFPCCGDYLQPNLKPIKDQKDRKKKQFFEQQNNQIAEQHKILPYDGIYDNFNAEQSSSNELIRLKTRLIRDLREQYFQQNAQFVMDNEFYHNHLSRISSISLEKNQAINTFQKNAILAQRNNQKKSMPFQLQINIGCLFLTKHQLQNQQQLKFEQLKVLLREFSQLSTYPKLPQIQQEIDYLEQTLQKLKHIQSREADTQIIEVKRKIDICTVQYDKEKQKMQKLLKNIYAKWKQIKQQRRVSGIQTVPWKLYIKKNPIKTQLENLFSYDIGVSLEANDKKLEQANVAQAENKRRQSIRSQKYFLKIYINGNQVAQSQKVQLQWPNFRVPINSKFSVTVYSAPSSIQIEVIKSGIINKTIDTVNLTLPGGNSKTITSSERRFEQVQFASNGPKFRSKKVGEHQNAIAPAGVIVYEIQWKGQGSRMPPVSFKTQQQETAATQKQEQDENINFIQFYDKKDPRAHQKTRFQLAQGAIARSHGALLPFVDTQSARHLLLKIKATHPQYQKLEIPLTQQEILIREDLNNVIQKLTNQTASRSTQDQQYYNSVKYATQNAFQQINRLLKKTQLLKLNALKGTSSTKYKITEQIINQYIFQQMESPIVVFFKNLFTQKRKLGPQITYYMQAKNVIDKMEVNIHLRAAKNMPIREQSLEKLKLMEQNQQMYQQRLRLMQNNPNIDTYTGYGMGFYNKAPNMNPQGRNFFVAGLPQTQNRMNFQSNYSKERIQRTNTFVIMRFKKNLKRTRCFEGPFPEWNQTISFSYDLKKEGMTVQKLYANNQKMIKLFLFDMAENTKPVLALASTHLKKTKYYLGRIDIPMSMMVAIPSLSGQFAVERPLILFGYTVSGSNQQNPGLIEAEHPEIATLVNIDMFSDPLIDGLTAYNDDKKFITGAKEQNPLFLQRCSDWLSDLNTKAYIRLWLNNIEGKSIFICKYLSPGICPPQELGQSIERCARFVSLIPKKYNCKLMQNTEQFHLTCQQLLKLRMGEDHGILLCNYFNFIDRKAGKNFQSYLVLGKAFPYGKSIYVLRKNMAIDGLYAGDCELWDPYSGHCYYLPAKQYDVVCCFFRTARGRNVQTQKDFCNMLQIGSIVTPDNIYLNIQDSLKPDDLDFNLEDEKLWKPFLTEKMKKDYFGEKGILTIQPDVDENFYKQFEPIPVQKIQKDFTSETAYGYKQNRQKQPTKLLQRNLKQYIQKRLQDQRTRHFNPHTTKKNNSIQSSIYNLLGQCQILKSDCRTSGVDSTLYDLTKKQKYTQKINVIQQRKFKIKQLIDPQKILYGITLNMPYTTKLDVLQKVKQTEIHLQEQDNIQFIISVRCFEIACNLISVWIFIGSITYKTA